MSDAVTVRPHLLHWFDSRRVVFWHDPDGQYATEVIYDEAVDLLTTHSSNLGYLPAGSDATVRAAQDDPNAFRGNKMAQLKQATDQLRAQIDELVMSNRSQIVEVVQGRKAEIEASFFYAGATPDAQESVLRRIDQVITHVRVEKQIALIRELGSSFEETVYPGLLDQLAAAQKGGDDGDGGTPPSKQTVSIKTISATGVSGVLETEGDINRYVAALHDALVQTVNDGKRIAL